MATTVFDLLGEQWFVELVDRFYDTVADDPVLAPLYPDDLTDSRRHLAGFLVQYWGGPTDYSDERGHPRLRMRHAPFAIGAVERDAWFNHMADALRAGDAPPQVTDVMLDYFERAATAMINQT